MMKFFLFTTDTAMAQEAQGAGVDSIIVDWEFRDKEERQDGHNLETNRDTVDNLRELAKNLSIPVTVRVNALGEYSRDEINLAIDNGAQIIMLPMARTVSDISAFIQLVGTRARKLVQIETVTLVEQIYELATLPWDYAYIGLNDLSIQRKSPSIWDAVLDGTVEKICVALKGKTFGFGGITVIGGGNPIRFDLLLHEYVRLGCTVGFLRRCFKQEIIDRDFKAEFNAIRSFIEASEKRKFNAMQFDYQRLIKNIKESKES